MQSYQKQINDAILKKEYGSVFITSDFLDIASFDTVNRSLNRLNEKKIIKRVIRGIYYKPKFSKIVNQYTYVNPNDVAEAIARNFGWKMSAFGLTALNLLGLSTQIPAVWEYVCNGHYREYSFDNITISFKKVSNKEISNYSSATLLVIQAIKAIGKDKITDSDILTIAQRLTYKEKIKMFNEAKTTTAWIYEVIRKIYNCVV